MPYSIASPKNDPALHWKGISFLPYPVRRNVILQSYPAETSLSRVWAKDDREPQCIAVT